MSRLYHTDLYHELREQYPFFVFQSYKIVEEKESLRLSFNFNLANKFTFEPSLRIPSRPFYRWHELSRKSIQQLAFHIGMVELISYWKAACPPRIIIKPFRLNPQQQQWWKKLYFHGLGEFFYVNGIEASMQDFMQIESDSDEALVPANNPLRPSALVPVGGGKDSVVSLELIKGQGTDFVPFIVNPREASLGCAETAGFLPDEMALVERNLDPELLRLNEAGFLNGHTPFSALLAFVAAMVAVGSGRKYIVLSNESSANEATVAGTDINHQYSKSIDFERDFRDYCQSYLHEDLEYFSLLRPLNELQIGRLFSRQKPYFSRFKSCNVGSKTDQWCGQCAKCMFTWIILAPFLSAQTLTEIFGKDLSADESLLPLLRELAGYSEAKPFECVGTVAEVKAVLAFVVKQYKHELPALYQAVGDYISPADLIQFDQALKDFDELHHLPPHFLKNLKEVLNA